MWDEHIRLFIRPRLFSAQWVYGYWKGVAVSLLPRRSQYFSLSFISPSLPLFSLIQYFLQNTALRREGKAGRHVRETKKKKHKQRHAHADKKKNVRQHCQEGSRKNSCSGHLSATSSFVLSHLPNAAPPSCCLLMHVHGAPETNCGLFFTRLMFANDF